jgi:hypothetical protein
MNVRRPVAGNKLLSRTYSYILRQKRQQNILVFQAQVDAHRNICKNREQEQKVNQKNSIVT